MLNQFLLLSAILFSAGVYGVLAKRNGVIVLMSIELILNAVNINLVAFGAHNGTITGAVPGAPVRVTGAAALRDSADDAQLDVHVVIEVRIPLVGGKIESFSGGQLAEMVRLEQEFTTEWIREHI